jgi:hypothetical protein
METLPSWRVAGKSVRGSTHYQTNLPNQDSLGWWVGSQEGLPVILVISDGHGSERNFRSHTGSKIAVKVTIQVLQDFLLNLPDPKDLEEIKNLAAEQLPGQILNRWEKEVSADLSDQPFIDGEFQPLSEKRGPAVRDLIDKFPLFVYGATLVAVMITESFILYIQLGDGDVLCVDADGQTYRPYPRDDRLANNETTSLCSLNPADFHVRLVPRMKDAPVLVLAASDGYTNSFPSEEEFLKVGKEYLRATRLEGLEAVNNQLKSTLKHISRLASGDDITLGILKRSELLDYDHLMVRFFLIDENLTSLRSDIADLSNQTDFRKQWDDIRSKINTISGSLSQMDIQTSSLQKLLGQLETSKGNENRSLPDQEAHLRNTEECLVSLSARQFQTEQILSEIQTGLKESQQLVEKKLARQEELIESLLAVGQGSNRGVEEIQQKFTGLIEKIQHQEQVVTEMKTRRQNLENQVRLIFALLIFLGVIALLTAGLPFFLK